VWLDLHEPTEAALTRVAEVFGLHRWRSRMSCTASNG
jgi:Mg2+ and Co2+ transporter CorA